MDFPKIGYARVSSASQNIQSQIDVLISNGAAFVVEETISGGSKARPELDKLIEGLEKGQTLLVTRLDRLGRSLTDVINKVDQIVSKGAVIVFCEQGLVIDGDRKNSTSRLVLQMLAMISEFELEIRKERQREGIELAKKRGVYSRANTRHNPEKLRAVHALMESKEPLSLTKACDAIGISLSTYYRLLKQVVA